MKPRRIPLACFMDIITARLPVVKVSTELPFFADKKTVKGEVMSMIRLPLTETAGIYRQQSVEGKKEVAGYEYGL